MRPLSLITQAGYRTQSTSAANKDIIHLIQLRKLIGIGWKVAKPSFIGTYRTRQIYNNLGPKATV